jgi:hypothetical protein
LKYLRDTIKPDGGLPIVAPFDVFEIAGIMESELIPNLGAESSNLTWNFFLRHPKLAWLCRRLP